MSAKELSAGPSRFQGLNQLFFAPAILCALAGGALAAQEETRAGDWLVRFWLDGGYQAPTARMAKNAPSDVEGLAAVETVGDFHGSPFVGAFVDVEPEAMRMAFGLAFRRTLGAAASGKIGLCGLVPGTLCIEPEADVTINDAELQIRFLSGAAGRLLRPFIGGGVGLRWYQFELPECPTDPNDVAYVCGAIIQMFQDPKLHSMIHARLGFRAEGRRLASDLALRVGTGRYAGGAGRTDGNWYQDIRLEFGLGARAW